MYKLKKFLPLILCFILTISLAACSNKKSDTSNQSSNSNSIAYPLTIKDSYDREVKLDKEPNRIISTSPNITETICALGKKDKLVGRTDFCTYPSDVKNIQSIGGIENPNIEKIVDLKPDIVVASYLFKKEAIQKLEALDIKVVVIQGTETFDGAYDTIKKVGQIVNNNKKADEIVTSMKKKVDEVSKKVQAKQTPSMYYVVSYGKDGDFTAGKNTFISKMINMAGGKNIADDTEGWTYSIEKIIEKNPDMIVCSKYMNTKDGIKSTNGYKDLNAVKNNKLYEIDNDLLDRQGPRLADGLEALAKIIHPEAFK